jgi:hypothetical protein
MMLNSIEIICDFFSSIIGIFFFHRIVNNCLLTSLFSNSYANVNADLLLLSFIFIFPPVLYSLYIVIKELRGFLKSNFFKAIIRGVCPCMSF